RFLFTCSVRHSYLPSFPTRRSSDLVDASSGNIRLFVQISDFIDRAAVNPHAHPKLGMTFEFLANLHGAADRRFRAGAENKRTTIDRKSTRLNSSHVAISYAVFCLKK